MNRIQNAFENKKAFIAFLTAGDPLIDKTEEYILKMISAGADLIEIGIPFSDPIAEGEVIQRANIRALSSGTNTDKIFSLVSSIRKKTDIPIVFLTYINPVFKYGYDKFFTECRIRGVDGIIIPDLPYEERNEVSSYCADNDIDIISLISPTSEERIEKIAEDASGYIYIVSSMGVTGMRDEIKTDLRKVINNVRKYTDVPAAVGFGINTPEQASEISRISDGIIVGSAIVKIIEAHPYDAGEYLYDFVKSIKEKM